MQATVQEMESKPTRNGGQLFRVKLDGNWISAGFKAPPCKVGDVVEYTTVQNGNYTNIGRIAVIGQGTSPASNDAGSSYASSPVRSDRERSIVRQNSVTNAVNLYKMLVDHGSIPVAGNAVTHAQEVLVVARVFEMYSMQDMDVEALNEKMEQLLSGTAEAE